MSDVGLHHNGQAMNGTHGRSGTSNDTGKPMIGIYDFSYGPYALGDALTWTMNLNVLAASRELLAKSDAQSSELKLDYKNSFSAD